MPSETVVVKSISKAVSEGFFYYFGYGSNLLKERIHVQIKEAVFESTGVLSCHELTFYDSSRRWFGAIASIEPKPISK
uniref:gamma-glutamylcyclotransferase n=1 Tax=Acrobeloides nanus TaxID=290746 RepID=A0A914D367_9BILA